MPLDIHGRLTLDAKQAQGALRETSQDTRELQTSVDQLGGKGKEAASEIAALQAQLDGYRQELGQLRSAQAGSIKQIDEMARTIDRLKAKGDQVPKTFNGAAGSVGNLTSQFNDIGVMLATGQNPLQLAIQQGTQIGQVFQQTGAKGKDAARLILSGFTAMLSPVNLITIGSIAAGAAMTNWLMSSSKEAETLDDVLDRLSGRVSDLKNDAALSAEAVKKEFGSISPALAQMLAEIRDRGLTAIQDDATKAAQALIQEVGGLALDIGRQAWREGDDAGRRAVQDALRELDDATTFDEQTRAIENLKNTVASVARGLVDAADKQRQFRDTVLDTERALRQSEQASNAILDTLRQGWDGAVASVRTYGAARIEAWQSASGILRTMQEENDLQRAILSYGEESVEVVNARQAAERRAFEEMLASSDEAETLKQELRAAFEVGQKLEALDIASGIWGAADAASSLVANLSNAAAQKAALASISGSQQSAARSQILLDTVGKPAERAGRLAVNDFRRELPDGGYGMIASGSVGRLGALGSVENVLKEEAENAARLEEAARSADSEYRKLTQSLKSGRKGGGKSRTKEEKDEVAELMASLDQELALLRELDPVQREMIRVREQLASATDAERAAIRDKITTIEEEKAAQERLGETRDEVGGLMRDFFDGFRTGASGAVSALQRVQDKLWDIGMQALIFGDGPLGNLFGGGLLGLLGLKDGGDVQRRASGGMTYGMGSSRDDRVLVAASPGEFWVNADATAKYRPLLEAINAGAPLPGFANGGGVGGAAAPAQAAGPMKVQFVDATDRGLSKRRISDGIGPNGQRFPRYELADMMGGAAQVRGGGFSKLLRARGLGEKGTLR